MKWVLVGEAWRKKARRLLQDLVAGGITLIAPPLFEYEVESVLQTRLESGALTVPEATPPSRGWLPSV